MTTVINKLTEEQVNALPKYAEKWINIGLNSDPIDYERAKELITAQYIQEGLDVPEFKYSKSPMESKEILGEDYDTNNACYGHHDASWLCFYDFFKEECNLECVNPLVNLIELSKVCGWWYPYDTLCVIEERPKVKMIPSEVDEDVKVLHCEDGYAVEYPDGFGLCFIEGKAIKEKRFIFEPESITVSDIENAGDNDLASILLERYGWSRYYNDIGATPIDSRFDAISNQHEALFKTEKLGKRLLVTCPTARMFSLPVNVPEVVCCETAQNFLNGKGDQLVSFNIIART